MSEDLEEDETSGYRPASSGDLVKQPIKDPYPSISKSASSSKSKDKSKYKVKSMRKTYKCAQTKGAKVGEKDDDVEAVEDDVEHRQR